MSASFPWSRQVARRLVRHASNVLRHTRPSWSEAIEHELEHIDSSHGALIWAVGCVWAGYVERYLNKVRSALSATAFVIAIVLIVPFSLAFLYWYTVSLGGLGMPAGAKLALPRLALGLGVMVLAGAAAPGRWQWRVTVGVAFPFLAFLAFLATAWIGVKASNLIFSLSWPHGRSWLFVEYGIAGVAFGATMALVLSLPFALVYRSRAVLIAILALMPEISFFIWNFAQRQNTTLHPAMTFTGVAWPWVCALIAIAMCIRACNRRLPHSPEGTARGSFS